MEFYQEFLFTSILSVVLVILLGKLFSGFADDAAGERRGKNDSPCSDDIDADVRADSERNRRGEKGGGADETESGGSPDLVEVERVDRDEDLGREAAGSEMDVIRVAEEATVVDKVRDILVGEGEGSGDAGLSGAGEQERKFRAGSVGGDSVSVVPALVASGRGDVQDDENRFVESSIEDSSVGMSSELEVSECTKAGVVENRQDPGVSVEDPTVREMPALEGCRVPESDGHESRTEVGGVEDYSVRRYPELEECLVEMRIPHFGVEKEVYEAESGSKANVERAEELSVEEDVEVDDGKKKFIESTIEDSSAGKLVEADDMENRHDTMVSVEDDTMREMSVLEGCRVPDGDGHEIITEAGGIEDYSVRKIPELEKCLVEIRIPHSGMQKEADEVKSGNKAEDERAEELLVGGGACEKYVIEWRGEEKQKSEAVVKEGSEEKNRGNDETEQSLLIDEDEWEGIEQTELQKHFHEAAAYVGGEGGEFALSSLSDAERMQLYALHKLAMEGPCYDPQPIAVKMSARAKWNAWQRLGKMNPDIAMEQYMNILSEKIPGWMDGKPEEDVQIYKESEVAGTAFSTTDVPDVCSKPPNQLNTETERKQDYLTANNEGSESATMEHDGQGLGVPISYKFLLSLFSPC